MENKKIFVDGLIVKTRRDTAPDWIKGHLSIKVQELRAFLDQYEKEEWLNVDICQSKLGKLYAQLNTFKPQPKAEEAAQDPESAIPF